jgi:hypothetical protein
MYARIVRPVRDTAGSPAPTTTGVISSVAAMKTSYPALRAAVASGTRAKTVAGLPAATNSILRLLPMTAELLSSALTANLVSTLPLEFGYILDGGSISHYMRHLSHLSVVLPENSPTRTGRARITADHDPALRHDWKCTCTAAGAGGKLTQSIKPRARVLHPPGEVRIAKYGHGRPRDLPEHT